MENGAIIFIPLVNPDGVAYIDDYYAKTGGRFAFIRKNRNISYEKMQICPEGEKQGVDLNRNYGYKFGFDNEGSSGNYCGEDFRGPEAFSEPETRAMRDFLYAHPNVKIALNFHAWGPLFITPYNWDKKKGNHELPAHAKQFYDEVHKYHTGALKGYLAGNGMQTIGYNANGEASDWMLHELGILAMSPELGIDDRRTEDFFIRDASALVGLVQGNFSWIEHTIKLLFEKIHCSVVKS